MPSRSFIRKCSAALAVLLFAAMGVAMVSLPSVAAEHNFLGVWKFDKATNATLSGMTLGGESCVRSVDAQAWACEPLPSDVTDMSDTWTGNDITDYVTMMSPVGNSCSVSAVQPSASMQKVRLWESVAPEGYDVISGEIVVCYTASGWMEMSNSAADNIQLYNSEQGTHVQFFDTKTGSGPIVEYPGMELVGVCGIGNDIVMPTTSTSYTSSSPVWSGTQVSITFTMSPHVTNTVFRNGQLVMTVTEEELDTTECSSSPTPTPTPTATSAPTLPPVPSPTLPVPTLAPVPVVAPEKVAKPKTRVKRKCGANNDRVKVAKGKQFTSKLTKKWRKNRLKVTYKTKPGFVFSNGATKFVVTIRDKRNRACD